LERKHQDGPTVLPWQASQDRPAAAEWAALALTGHLPYICLMPRSSARQQVSRGRAERLEARITRDQKALLQRAADLQGRSLTDFVVSSAHDAAVRTIEEMQMIRLSAEDSRALAEALLNPRKPTERLRAAARRYMEKSGG
jgi:uncharacterized protein (DUF1778 family)